MKKLSHDILPCGRVRQKKVDAREVTERQIKDLTDKFEKFCNEKALRTSTARRKIVALIVKEFEHFTLPEVLSRLEKKHPEVGRATLYRTIPFLVAAGILQEGAKSREGLPLYELAKKKHHDHIVCLDCNEVFEFENETIEREQEKITHRNNFLPERHTHVIYAHCRLWADKKHPK